MRKIFYRDAVREALDEEMARDPMVMMIGEDIGVGDGTWKCSKGLREKYGDLRMKDSPISEAGFTGVYRYGTDRNAPDFRDYVCGFHARSNGSDR